MLIDLRVKILVLPWSNPMCMANMDHFPFKNGTPSNSVSSTMSTKKPTAGRWTREEHKAFLKGLKIHGREWKKVAQEIPTRTSAQIRSHAQKYFAKLSRDEQTRACSVVVMQEGSASRALAMNTDVEEGTRDDSCREYPPSVLDRMEKILRDPLGAELEVAETLNRLRERYRELHAKLQKQERMREEASLGKKEELDKSECRNSNHGFIPTYATCPTTLKTNTKFTFMEPSMKIMEDGEPPTHEGDNTASGRVVPTFMNLSTTPSSPRPCMRICDESLALHSQELIALSVLGGELYRSASHQDLSKIEPSTREKEQSWKQHSATSWGGNPSPSEKSCGSDEI